MSSGVSAIALGPSHTCALTTTGDVKCWGWNKQGQLGDGSTKEVQLVPMAVSCLSSGVRAIALGTYHTCALMTTGGVKCWGQNIQGQLGDGSFKEVQLTQVAVSGLSSGVHAIALGRYHTCALQEQKDTDVDGKDTDGDACDTNDGGDGIDDVVSDTGKYESQTPPGLINTTVQVDMNKLQANCVADKSGCTITLGIKKDAKSSTQWSSSVSFFFSLTTRHWERSGSADAYSATQGDDSNGIAENILAFHPCYFLDGEYTIDDQGEIKKTDTEEQFGLLNWYGDANTACVLKIGD